MLLRTSSTGVAWELVRNAASQAPPGPPDSETLGRGPALRVLTSLPGDFDARSGFP